MDEAGLAGAQQLRDAGATVGEGVRAWLGELIEIGTDVEVADGATVVADRLRLGDGVRIAAGCDLRSGSIVIGAGTELLAGAAILVADAFEIGTAGRIEQRVNITCRSFRAGKLFYFGHDSAVGYGGTNASTAHVHIGDRVALGPHSILNANFPIELADQVGSGCNLTMWTHGFHFGHRLLDGYSADFSPIRVDSNVWLGFHVTLLPGVHIGANTIVAAGAVVARSLPHGRARRWCSRQADQAADSQAGRRGAGRATRRSSARTLVRGTGLEGRALVPARRWRGGRW